MDSLIHPPFELGPGVQLRGHCEVNCFYFYMSDVEVGEEGKGALHDTGLNRHPQ